MRTVLLLNLVGLTPGDLGPETPALSAPAARGAARPMAGVFPAVTTTAQATMLTGRWPDEHGIVGNGWLWRAPCEVRFWQQANALVAGEKVYETAARLTAARGRPVATATLCWWYNEGAAVDVSVTPKPHYGCDGDKRFDVQVRGFPGWDEFRRAHGPFPFPAFWGPAAGAASTEWIVAAARFLLDRWRPAAGRADRLLLVYLPHLDYDQQRFGPHSPEGRRAVRTLDALVAPLLDEARAQDATVIGVSEYGLAPVTRAVELNRVLRAEGLLAVRDGPFGEMLDVPRSRAVAVCDHQIAHVYLADPADAPALAARLATLPGVGDAAAGPERARWHLDHERAGDVVLAAAPAAWFAYPYWQDDARAPDFARTVDIHRKPGYDPCELFFDPALRCPRLRLARRLLAKRLGFRTRFDVVPLDPALVRGSHGRLPADPARGPLCLVSDPALTPAAHLREVPRLVLDALGLGENSERLTLPASS